MPKYKIEFEISYTLTEYLRKKIIRAIQEIVSYRNEITVKIEEVESIHKE